MERQLYKLSEEENNIRNDYDCCKTMLMTNFLQNVYKRNTIILDKDNFHKVKAQEADPWHYYIAMHIVVIDNQRNYQKRISRLSDDELP